jgi:hypothetical protein
LPKIEQCKPKPIEKKVGECKPAEVKKA